MSSTERTRPDEGWASADDLPTGPNGRPLCRYCKMEVEPPRRTFCGAACVHLFKIESNPGYAREQVYERDKGVCQTCGLDTEALKKIMFELRLKSRTEYEKLVRDFWLEHRFGFEADSHYWEMDHTKAVVLGGGSCGLDNLKTLCVPCHRRKTKQDLRKHRASMYDPD